VVVRRTVDCIEFVALPAAQFTFLEALGRRTPLGAAVDLALAVDGGFDPGAALRRCVALGLFTSASV
jgi:hypothetical protein